MDRLKFIKIFSVVCILFFSKLVLPICPDHSFIDPQQIQFTGNSVLIVTHPSIDFDGRMSTKVGMDASVQFAKKNKIPVIYLQDNAPNEKHFFEDCKPNYWVFSQAGELSFKNIPRHVYSVGGHWELCQSVTLNDILLSWSKQPTQDATITFFMDAIYMKASMSFQETDPYYSDFQRFIGIVNYDRVISEAFSNKITMLESMGIIANLDSQVKFLTRILPPYHNTLPNHRVVIKLGDTITKVLQKGNGSNAPVLTFEFVNSALGKY